MLAISKEDISRRLSLDNPWWDNSNPPISESNFTHRVYFESFSDLSLDTSIRRATVLLGPRRVGKTVMAKQLVLKAIAEGFKPENILYVSVDTPAYQGIHLDKFLEFLPPMDGDYKLVIFDEIQYLENWESHLKNLVDTYQRVKFVATGSAAAALRLKSLESGAGRFTDFILPPLTFHEFLRFVDKDEELVSSEEDHKRVFYRCHDIAALNHEFLNYLNYGGYPEVVLSEGVRNNAERFVKNDIIDKVLLKDLPSLYGIQNIQDLNRLFTMLAYNTGSEVNLQNIAQDSGMSKPTISKYLTYLESAFLIIKIPTVNLNCKRLSRERNFKIYLTNPSMRAALFSPVQEDETDKIGHLTEAAIFSQWQHSTAYKNLRYSRWNGGEVDMVFVDDSTQKPVWAGEIKWSDKSKTNFNRIGKHLSNLVRKNSKIKDVFFTSKTYAGIEAIEDLECRIVPSALYAYTVGRNITKSGFKSAGTEFLDVEEWEDD